MPFACSICEQESTKICAFCTKDACDNHLCERCGFCSDCCECEVPLDEVSLHPQAEEAGAAQPEASADAEPPEPLTQSESPLPANVELSSPFPETPEV